MAAQSLGTLTIDLQAKTATLQSDLGKAARLAEQASQQMTASAVAAGVAIGNALSAAIGKIPEAISGSLDKFDNFSKAAQKVGVTTEEFSKLAYAAGLSDVGVDDLTTTVIKLDKNLASAADGNKTLTAQFAALGITSKDPIGALNQLADLFHSLPDGAAKTGIAVTFLGKSGASMIPLLNGGSAALKDLGDEAEKFGLVVSEDVGKQAEEFNDDIKKLQDAAGGFRDELTKQLLPALTSLSDGFVDATKQGDGLNEFADGMAVVFLSVAKAAAYVVEGVRDITVTTAALFDNVSNGDKFKTLLSNFAKAVDSDESVSKGILAQSLAGDTAYTDQIAENHKKLAQTLASLDTKTTITKDNGATEGALFDQLAGAEQAAAALKKYQDVQAAAKAADDAAAAAKKALAAQLREQTSLEQREIAVKNAMAAGVEKATDQLYKSDIPGLDEYNKSLQETNKQVAQFTQQDTNKITHAISPADVKAISDYKDQMTQLATATLAAARAKNDLDQQDQTASFEAQAADSKAATAGVAGLAEENYNYAKSLQAAALAFENNTASDATDLYTRQVAALGTLHDAAVKNINDQYDQGVIATKSIASGLGDELAAQIDGTAAHEGFKGFIDDFEAMITEASAKAIAANLIQKLLGNASQTGQVGGWLGSLFDSGVGSNTSSAADAVRAQETSVTGSGSSNSWLSLLGSLFGGGKAIGGAVSPNKGYLVGENGPEFFSPSTSGMIIPNGGLAGAGGPSVRNTFFLAAPTSARTQNQIANRTQFDLNRASRLR